MKTDNEADEVVTKEDKKEAKRLKKQKRTAHLRGFKNFGWWFFGFLSSFIIVGGSGAICVCVLPISTYFGNDGKYIDKDVSNKTFLNLAMNYKDYSLANFPILKSALESVVKSAGLDKYVEINYDALADELTFDFNNISFEDIYKKCINVVCTIDSLGLADLLGDFKNLSIMNNSTEVTETIDLTKPYLYYYKNSNNVLKRAYDDNGDLLEEAKGKVLYYPALRKIPLDELFDVLPDRLGQEEVLNLLSMVTDITSDSVFEKLFKGYTVKEVGSFDVDSVCIGDLIDITDDNRSMFDIICSAIKLSEGETKPTPETLTVKDLSSIDIDQVHLVDIIEPNDNNKDLFSILRSASGKDNDEDITILDIMEVNIDNVKLSSLLEYEGNEKLCDILVSITGKESYDDVYFNDLKDVDTNNIKLSSVVTSLDEKLKKILTKGSGVASFDDLTVGDLENFDMNSVYLSDAMTDLSDKLKDILVTGCGKDSYEELKFDDLNNFDMDNLDLSLVLEDNESNSKLISILLEASGKSLYSEMKVSDLTDDFNIDRVRLVTVIGENENLFDILADATSKDKNEITISDLSSFSLSNIKLSTVIKENTGNKILDTLLSDDSVTLANIGEKINDLKIFDIYGDQCFTQDASEAIFTSDHYVKSEVDGKVTYTIDLDGEYSGDYYVSKNSGLFGLLAMNITEYDSSTGRGNVYVESDFKYSDLETSSNTSTIIENATIYQLVAAGVINDKVDGSYSNKLLKMTFKDVLLMIDQLS